MSYLITLVDNEVPIDMYSVLQDSEKQILKVMDSAFGVDNILASSFLNASGKVVKIPLGSLQVRSEGITFFLFGFKIDPT